MADGIRIRPRDDIVVDDNGIIVVIDHARPFPPPTDGTPIEIVQPVCSVCGVQHFAKAYHIQLIRGSAIVSETVWENLQSLRTMSGDLDNPFVMENVVKSPPSQRIDIDTGEQSLVEKYVMPISTRSDYGDRDPHQLAQPDAGRGESLTP